MPARPRPVYFTDENTLGLGKLLARSGRDDVRYPGHENLPEVPLGTPDVEWMKVVARLDFVVVTRDRRIRTRPAELKHYHELGLRSGGSVRSRTSVPATRSSCSSSTSHGYSGRSSSAAPDRGRSP